MKLPNVFRLTHLHSTLTHTCSFQLKPAAHRHGPAHHRARSAGGMEPGKASQTPACPSLRRRCVRCAWTRPTFLWSLLSHSLSLSPYVSVMGEQREGIKCQAASGQPRCGSRGVRTRHGGVWAALGLGDMMVQKAPGGPLGCPHTAPGPQPPAKGSPVRRVRDSGERAGLRQPRPTVDTAKVSFLSVSRVHQGGHRTLLTLLSTDGGSVSTRELCISARRYSGE